MEVRKIYFDMDDTIADFSRGISEICGLVPKDQRLQSEEEADAMWAAVSKAGDFYYRLKECAPGVELFRKLREKYGNKVAILSAVPKPKRNIPTAEADKRRWMLEHFGADVIVNITSSAEGKTQYVTGSDCYLIDDLEDNVDAWKEAGGTAIQFSKDDATATETEVKNSGLL